MLLWVRTLFVRFAAFFQRRTLESRLKEELSLHTELLSDDLKQGGISDSEAERRARILLGGRDQINEEYRDVFTLRTLSDIFRDLRYAMRHMRRARSVSLIAIVTLALGIGATTTIYTIVYATILKPLPFTDPDQLFRIEMKKNGRAMAGAFQDEYHGWTEKTHSFNEIFTYGYSQLKLNGTAAPELLSGYSVPHTFFAALGVKPILGRYFSNQDDRPGAPPLIVLGYGLWQRRFNGQPSAVGSTIQLEEKVYTIIGVAPNGFSFPLPSQAVDYWIPLSQDQNIVEYGSRGLLRAYARLKPGIGVLVATADLNTVCRGLGAQFSGIFSDRSASLKPLRDEITGAPGKLPLILFAAVIFVLLVAVANVANLLLAQAVTRSKEISIRLSIGASRWRIMQQLMTESLVLSLAGGILGLGLVAISVKIIASYLPANVPRVAEIQVDWGVGAFALGVSLIAGILFGLYPAWTASQRCLFGSLNQRVRSRSLGRTSRSALTIGEIACAIILCIGAGLLLKSLVALLSIDIGVDPKNVVAIHVPMSYDLFYQERSVRLGINNSMIDAVSSLPGVATAGIASEIPFRLATAPFGTYIIDDSPTSRAQGTIGVQQMVVSPGYFRAMGLRLVRGRFFDETDNRHDGRFVIVSEDIAETLWPGQDPVMKTLLSGSPPTQRYTVIGVAKNIKKSENNARVWQPSVYYALSSVDMPPANRFLVIRTAIDARPMVDAFQRAIWSVDRNQVIKSTYFMEDEAERDLNGPRFRGLLLGCFAGIAFGIAIIGIYGVISHSVSTRMHEMGVRVALGAQRGDIMSHVLAEGIVLIISGILIGIFGALILGGLIRSYLFGVTPTDTITYLVIAVTFCCVGVLACAIPARRACTADPLVVLRSE